MAVRSLMMIAVQPPAAGGGISAAELSAGLANLKSRQPVQDAAVKPGGRAENGTGQAAKGGGMPAITAGDLASARGKLKGVLPNRRKHSRGRHFLRNPCRMMLVGWSKGSCPTVLKTKQA